MSVSRPAIHTALGLAAALLGGCTASPPQRYYTLESLAAPTQSASDAGAIPLRVERVTIPAELDRQALVQRIGPGEVRISELDRWAAPLAEMIRRTLSADLASRLGAEGVADPQEPATRDPRRKLFLDVTDLYADSSCAITLRVSWTLQSPTGSDQHANEAIEGAAAAPCPGGMAQG